MSSTSNYDIDITGDVSRVRKARHLDGSWDWFQRLWGVAVIAHLVGNPASGQLVGAITALGLVSFATGLLAVAAVLRPDDRRLLWSLSAAVPLIGWLEAPVLSNHWLLASVISITLLVSQALRYGWPWFATVSRAMLLAFYGFVVLAKLNSAFFDSAVSCAVVYANQSLGAIGVSPISPDSVPATLLPFVVVGVEVAIPVLLLRSSTRFAGVVLGLAFHGLISFDLGQHFYDFTAVMFPLLLLWSHGDRLDRLGEYLPERTQLVAGVTLVLFVVSSVLPSTRLTSVLLDQGFFLVWIPFALALTVFVAYGTRQGVDVTYRPANVIGWVLVAVVAVNGLAPYLEVKTANSWNMYSNLAIVNGDSNHLLIRSGLPIFGGHGDLVEILSSDDPGLARYVGSDWRLADRALDGYLADNREANAEVRQRDTVLLRDASDQNVFVRKLLVLRAVDASSPADCQTKWLPAH